MALIKARSERATAYRLSEGQPGVAMREKGVLKLVNGMEFIFRVWNGVECMYISLGILGTIYA